MRGPTSAAAKLKDPHMVAMINAAAKVGRLADDVAKSDIKSTPPPSPTPQGVREAAPAATSIDGFMVIDAAGMEFLPESFAKTPQAACHQFHRLDWESIEQRELDVMSGRFHVRRVRIEVLGRYDWPEEASSE